MDTEKLRTLVAAANDPDCLIPNLLAEDGCGHCDWIAAANPQAITALLDERESLLWDKGILAERVIAAERRVAALEVGLRALVGADAQYHEDCGDDGSGSPYDDEVHDMLDKARALLAANDSEGGSGSLVPQVQALPPAAPSEPLHRMNGARLRCIVDGEAWPCTYARSRAGADPAEPSGLDRPARGTLITDPVPGVDPAAPSEPDWYERPIEFVDPAALPASDEAAAVAERSGEVER